MTETRILIIRCAHQKQNDFKVEACLNWSVCELKHHLRDVYPSNPEIDRQRLIYAGQMMKDDQPVQEYLKRLPSADMPIVHLVCTQKFTSPLPSVENEGLKRRKFTAPNPPVTPIIRQTSDLSGGTLPNSAPFPMAQSMPNFFDHSTVGFPNLPLGSFGANSGAATFDQTQAVHHPTSVYMNQYFQYLQQIYGVNPTNFYWPMYGGIPQYNAEQVVQQQPSANQAQHAPANQAAAQRQQPQVAMNAQGGVVEEAEEGGRHDWLDWAYTFCRASLLFAILFSYSSMERMTFVMFICFLFFAYHNGWFAARRNQPANNAGDRLANDNNNNRIGGENGAQLPLAETDADQVNNNAANIDPNTTLDANASAWHVFWSTCYTFFSSFFASLIPERAPPLNF